MPHLSAGQESSEKVDCFGDPKTSDDDKGDHEGDNAQLHSQLDQFPNNFNGKESKGKEGNSQPQQKGDILDSHPTALSFHCFSVQCRSVVV